MQWLAVGLAFVAVIVILRYARQPRCALCSRRHRRAELATPGPEAAAWAAIRWKVE
jgi:hypothetical protein